MTNMISSAEQARDALLKAREMSARVGVDFTTASASFSLEGRVFDATLMSVELEGDDKSTLRLSPMIECVFEGGTRMVGGAVLLELVITFRGADLGNLWRCVIESEWKA
jgi:hypothetical protein